MIRQLDAVIFAHSTEDFAKPAPSIDDARPRGRYESKRRGLQARIQQWLRREGSHAVTLQAASARPIAKQRGSIEACCARLSPVAFRAGTSAQNLRQPASPGMDPGRACDPSWRSW